MKVFSNYTNELNKGNALLKLGKEAESVAQLSKVQSHRMKKQWTAETTLKSLQSLGNCIHETR
jgi:hypothetical protein